MNKQDTPSPQPVDTGEEKKREIAAKTAREIYSNRHLTGIDKDRYDSEEVARIIYGALTDDAMAGEEKKNLDLPEAKADNVSAVLQNTLKEKIEALYAAAIDESTWPKKRTQRWGIYRGGEIGALMKVLKLFQDHE